MFGEKATGKDDDSEKEMWAARREGLPWVATQAVKIHDPKLNVFLW